jgi:glutathione synthase/RimK-type ligase-like ATP-grasp enzyme
LLIRVWSAGISEIMKGHTPLSCKDLRYYDTITVDDLLSSPDDDIMQVTAKAIQEAAGDFPIVSIMAGGDRGVDFADALSEKFGLLTNGTDIPNRRDKKIQQELVRESGLRAVRQAGGADFKDVEEFLKTEPYPVVVKPIESSGSDAVKLCATFEEAKEHFDLIMKTTMVDGGMNTGALCQEFLRGKEYIVDHVSRDGVHKT